ncbi:hypothetical protein LV564_09335 [Komagataeibacter nataicola]|nr:hypothetical protein [Komagataeibacter nataicola]WEQ54410.1 hypothetical protein LV564_09335 [Komagataeibacter nataicola]
MTEQKFLGAAFFQKGGVLLKLFEKSFTKNFWNILFTSFWGRKLP